MSGLQRLAALVLLGAVRGTSQHADVPLSIGDERTRRRGATAAPPHVGPWGDRSHQHQCCGRSTASTQKDTSLAAAAPSLRTVFQRHRHHPPTSSSSPACARGSTQNGPLFSRSLCHYEAYHSRFLFQRHRRHQSSSLAVCSQRSPQWACALCGLSFTRLVPAASPSPANSLFVSAACTGINPERATLKPIPPVGPYIKGPIILTPCSSGIAITRQLPLRLPRAHVSQPRKGHSSADPPRGHVHHEAYHSHVLLYRQPVLF